MPTTSEHPSTAPELTLTDFLLARIAEDEAVAQAAAVMNYPSRMGEEYDWTAAILSADREATEAQDEFVRRWLPSRALTECKAKRSLMNTHNAALWSNDGIDGEAPGEGCYECDGLCHIIRTLAAVYADHPDYREVWLP